MKIAVLGLGCVGLVTAVGLAQCGYHVWGFELNARKLQRLKLGQASSTEPGLNEALQQQLQSGALVLSESVLQVLGGAEIIFIAVGTPARADGSADLSALNACVPMLAQHLSSQLSTQCLLVLRSTVPPGTTQQFEQQLQSALLLRGSSVKISVAFQPEFFQQGSALKNFHQPERLVLGAETPEAFSTLKQLYAPLQLAEAKILTMNLCSAELSKYAANAMLALRLSFINELSAVAESGGANIEDVQRVLGSDERIGPHFLQAGLGFGGPCLVKDLQALQAFAQAQQQDLKLVVQTLAVNQQIPAGFFQKISAFFQQQLAGRSLAVWGLSFKPESSDLSASPSLTLVELLLKHGAQVRAYDPYVGDADFTDSATNTTAAFVKNHPNFSLAQSAQQALQQTDALVLLTAHQAFSAPDFAELARTLKARAVFDARNFYQSETIRQHGLAYYAIGRS